MYVTIIGYGHFKRHKAFKIYIAILIQFHNICYASVLYKLTGNTNVINNCILLIYSSVLLNQEHIWHNYDFLK